MNLIAFDQSTTNTGWCVMEMDTSKIIGYGAIHPTGVTNERIRITIKKCMMLCKKFDVAFVYIEGIQVQRNPKVYEILAKLEGTLEICLEEKGYFVNIVKAAEWRKRIGIKNKKRDLVKQEAINMVKELYDLEPSEDECEAILFAKAFSA
ncbi:crossover junction endodeoxyribonuclease RuvC [Tetragenococcus halophilus]|uniref:Crossover junction endodeoxyribonuclease RuvC n=1 Tax=Tetragenococcus halophilus TaxID=51669 RepID=A0AB35HM26_TETHA|nr:crossover junction endodeoxyribonuclease RuvC [Tetragenococcus halophilus]MCO8297238.1 crossover junction endodeoxyribonuclease RuvC [Tetragenococcus halophilus]